MVLEVVGLVVGVRVMYHLDGRGVQTHLPALDRMAAIFPLGAGVCAVPDGARSADAVTSPAGADLPPAMANHAQ